ncbi:Bacterial Ig-like domain (group 2) [Bacteroidales bacterium Barb4]|nr:Bacterial Ig-like domain (group 2) [Bacteroidales bacterium Barb4]
MKRILLLIVSVACVSLPAGAKGVYVAANGSDGNAGSSWTDAFKTLQKALSAEGADTIRLTNGIYSVTDVSDTASFTVTKDLVIIGGFSGGGIVGGHGTYTTLAGDNLHRVMIIAGRKNAARINVTLQNLIIAEGNASDETVTAGDVTINANTGGGIYNVNANTTLDGVTVRNNVAATGSSAADYAQGGGIAHLSGKLTLTGNTLVGGNTAATGGMSAFGGGIAGLDSLIIVKASIVGNTAVSGVGDSLTGRGGGISSEGFLEIRKDVLIAENTAVKGFGGTVGRGFGGGLYTALEANILGGLIRDNTAGGSEGWGGGIYNLRMLKMPLNGGVLAGNKAHSGGDGIFYEPLDSLASVCQTDEEQSVYVNGDAVLTGVFKLNTDLTVKGKLFFDLATVKLSGKGNLSAGYVVFQTRTGIDLPAWISGDYTVLTADADSSNVMDSTFLTIDGKEASDRESAFILLFKDSLLSVTIAALNIASPNLLVLRPQETLTLKTDSFPAGFIPKIRWSSSDDSIATVDEEGTVTAHRFGSVTVTAQLNDYIRDARTVIVAGIALNETLRLLHLNDMLQLRATVFPDTASVTWSSSDADIAFVDQTGKVTIGGNTGSVTVTARLNFKSNWDNSFIQTECTVFAVTAALNYTEAMLVSGDTLRLVATVKPENAAEYMTWSSTSERIASVKDGIVVAKETGTAVITARLNNGTIKVECTVRVGIFVTGVTLSAPAVDTLKVRDARRLVATVTPLNATNQSIVWTSSDPDVATVNNYGQVIATGIGKATITVTTVDGGLADSCHIVVIKTESPITLGDPFKTMLKDSVFQLKVITSLEDVSAVNGITWLSLDTTVVKVDEGLVTAVGVGRAFITATIANGTFSARCEITVYLPVESIILSGRIAAATGEEFTVTAAVAPEEAEQSTVWRVYESEAAAVISASDLSCTFKALAPGRAIIRAESADGINYATHIVVVSDPASTDPNLTDPNSPDAIDETSIAKAEACHKNGTLHLRNMEGYRACITAVTGQTKVVFEVTSPDDSRVISLPASVYILNATNGKGRYVTKFVAR